MDKVKRKNRREHRKLRIILPPLLLILAVIVVILGWNTRKEASQIEVKEKILTAGTIEQRDSREVYSIQVLPASGEGWYAEQRKEGILTERDGFEISASLARKFLSEAAVIGYEDIFSEDPAEYADRLEDFGLADAASVVTITYTDGSSVTLRIGSRSIETETAYYYMTVDGRQPLYAISVSAAEDWKLPRNSLYAVEQPRLQTARMDHLLFEGQNQCMEWVLDAEITDDNASDAWVLVSPVHYPADGTEMTSFLKSIGNIRLGSFEARASDENMDAFGLRHPQVRITLHMAEGLAAVTGTDGAVTTEPLEEETIVLVVGGKKNDHVWYVQYGENVYLVSDLTLGTVIGKDPMDTIARYPVQVAAEYLSKLTIEDCVTGVTTVYQIQRQSSGENESEEITHCYENGQEIPFESFQARYLQMVLCTVSGEIPDGYRAGALKKIYTFEAVGGRIHTIRLYSYDSMHDALQMDDYPILFYLIQGGLEM
ncbi:MAG: DUF4340 domain-containing protein [Clostridiales bacterium]|nr:DUF4340 domain-containing protein [Clostridiales bacterium]